MMSSSGATTTPRFGPLVVSGTDLPASLVSLCRTRLLQQVPRTRDGKHFVHALGFRGGHFPALFCHPVIAPALVIDGLCRPGAPLHDQSIGKEPFDDSIERSRAQLHFPAC